MKRALDGTLDEADATDGSQSDTDSLGGAGAGALDGMSEASEDHYIEVAQPPSSPSKEDRALLLEAVSLIAKRRKEQERISAEDRVIHFDINGAEVNAPTGLRSLAELVGEATMKGKKSRLHLRGGDTNNRDVGGQGDGEERGGRKRSDSGAFERVRHLTLLLELMLGGTVWLSRLTLVRTLRCSMSGRRCN